MRDEVTIDHAGGTNLLRQRSLATIKDPNPETIRKRLEWPMASPHRVTDELVELRCALYTGPDTQASLTNVFANSFGDTARNEIPEGELAKIKASTLVLWSDKNPGAGPEAGRPRWEQAEEHDAVVSAFLRGKSPAPRDRAPRDAPTAASAQRP